MESFLDNLESYVTFYLLIWLTNKELDFSCVLETSQTVSLDQGITVNVNHFVVDLGEQLGSFNVEMAVYDSSDFSEPARLFKYLSSKKTVL